MHCLVESLFHDPYNVTSNTIGVIHRVRLPLADSTPVHVCAVILPTVVDRDDDSIPQLALIDGPGD